MQLELGPEGVERRDLGRRVMGGSNAALFSGCCLEAEIKLGV